MAITLETIEQKEFTFVQNGFDPNEVDDFLDEIMEEMQRLIQNNEQLTRELAAARAMGRPEPTQVVKPVMPVTAPSSNIPAQDVAEILAMAQRVKEDLIAKAKADADEIRRKAQDEAESRLGNLTTTRDDLTIQIDSLRASAKSMEESLRIMIQTCQDILKDEDL